MRLNVKVYKELIGQKGITDEFVQRATGLSSRTYDWLMKRGFIEVDTIERIADAIGVQVGKFLLPDYDKCQENVIEFIKDNEDRRATVTFSQGRFITKIKKLAEKYPDKCQIMAINKDGSIYAHIPVDWIRIAPPKEVSDKQLEASRRNLLNAQTIRRNNG